jgi:hypothetical protein
MPAGCLSALGLESLALGGLLQLIKRKPLSFGEHIHIPRPVRRSRGSKPQA